MIEKRERKRETEREREKSFYFAKADGKLYGQLYISQQSCNLHDPDYEDFLII